MKGTIIASLVILYIICAILEPIIFDTIWLFIAFYTVTGSLILIMLLIGIFKGIKELFG